MPVLRDIHSVVQHRGIYRPQEDAALFKQRDIVFVNTVIL